MQMALDFNNPSPEYEVDHAEKATNRKAGHRLHSAYVSKDGVKFWIITEADRSSTTVLLPEEY